MTRFPHQIPVAIAISLVLILASCGQSRSAPADALLAEETQDDSQAEGSDSDSESDDVTTPTSQPPGPTPTPSTAPAEDVVLAVDFGDEQWELAHGDLNAVIIPTWENEEFVVSAFGGSVPEGFYVGVTSEHLIDKILDRILTDVGGAVSAAEEQEAKDGLFTIITSWFPTSADPLADAERLYAEVPYLPFIIGLQAKQAAIGTALAASDELTVDAPCVRHILLETEADAGEVLGLLSDGGDFTELAAERSTGPTGPSGGDLGCSPSSSYVPEFAAAVDSATLGEYIGPVQTQFGWHILVVDRLEETQLDPAGAIDDRIRAELASLSVEVDPRVGTWDPAAQTIQPTVTE